MGYPVLEGTDLLTAIKGVSSTALKGGGGEERGGGGGLYLQYGAGT